MRNIENEETEENFTKRPLFQRFTHHFILDPKSFEGLKPGYLYPIAAMVTILIPLLRIGIFFILLSKVEFSPPVSDNDLNAYISSMIFGTIASTIVQIAVWGTFIYALLRLTNGKGKYLQTLALFAFSYIVIVITTLMLLIVAAAQPHIIVDTTVKNFRIGDAFIGFSGFNISNTIVVIISYLYAHIMAAVALSVEHKKSQISCMILSLLVYVIIMILFWLI